MRCEYAFVFFCGIGLLVLDLVLLVFAGGLTPFADRGALTPQLAGQVLGDFVLARLPVIFIVLGCAVVAFRKWRKGRQSSSDKALDSEIVRLRAAIAEREGRRVTFWIAAYSDLLIASGARESRRTAPA